MVRQLKYGRHTKASSRKDEPTLGSGMTTRYIGSLVADFHRNLLYGGVYLYPPYEGRPEGKLRMMCEAAPLAMVAENAGGYASNGHDPILSIKPTELHMRTPLYIGSRDDVLWIEKTLSKSKGSI